MPKDFLPVCRTDMRERGWAQLDFLFISGDAYVDHPSFATAIISRVLESEGFKVGIIAQPDIKNNLDFECMGRPRLGVLISSGNVDSMVAHYTAAKKKRSDDAYSPGGQAGKRPDRATIVYCNKVREIFSDIPIIVGGIEASLRRFAHYDYWDDEVRRPILFDCSANLLVYGMGEGIITEIAQKLNEGLAIGQLTYIDGTAYIAKDITGIDDAILCPSFCDVANSKMKYAKSVKMQYDNCDAITGKTLLQECDGRYLVQNKPYMPLNRNELDRVFSLPFTREVHPMYKSLGGVPAIEEVQFSIIISRGCFGGCNFCALSFHQGRMVQSRSHQSILNEAKEITWHPNFKGYIHDVGGPTANFRNASCEKQLDKGMCTKKKCLFPKPCDNLNVTHKDYIELLRKLRELDGVKKVFIRSGIRFDYVIADKDSSFLNELTKYHISGQLKVAPEHVSNEVLSLMGKPEHSVYEQFSRKFKEANERIGKNQYLVPYLMSSHPGSTLKSAIELAEYLKREGINPQQVQDFYPTPGTISTCMYYTSINPITMERVYVPRDYKEKILQRALLQFKKPENYDKVHEALIRVGRNDLIGYGPNCLIKPRENKKIIGGNSKNASKDIRRENGVSKSKRAVKKRGK